MCTSQYVSLNIFQVAIKTIPFYTEYFKVPYPLPKIDLIAIADFAAGKHNPLPSTVPYIHHTVQCPILWHLLYHPLYHLRSIVPSIVPIGAMENWGLVTYRERLLLVNEDTPERSKQTVAIVVG